MNTAYKWLLLILLCATPAFAQNVRVDNVTFSSVQGFPFLPGATITICTAAGTGLPCTPTVAGTCLSISDTTCNQSATLTSDALGNYGFWIQPGSYTYTITKAGFGGFGPKALTLPCQIACTVPQTFGNLNNIRIVDGVKFAQSAAGINAADADLGTQAGLIIVPSVDVTATDAQIVLSRSHKLNVLGSLTITSPILMKSYAGIDCTSNGGNAAKGGNIIAANGMASMVRGNTQDGTTETWYIQNCAFYGAAQTFTRYLLDLTGMNDRGYVQNVLMYSFTATIAAVGADGSGGGAGSSNFTVSDLWINPGSATPCINLSTSTSIFLQGITFHNIECQNSTAASLAIFNNTSASSGFIRQNVLDGFFNNGANATTQEVLVNGVNGLSLRNIFCSSAAATCVHVTNNSPGTFAVSIDNAGNQVAVNTTIQDDVNTLTINTPVMVSHYDIFNSAAPNQMLGYTVVPSRFYRPIVQTGGTGLQFVEGSAPTGIASTDQLWGDSANHCLGVITNAVAGPEVCSSGGFSIGSIAGQKRIDTGGSTGFEFRPINAANASTGMSVSTLQAVGSTISITGTGACATITTQTGGPWIGTFVCTGTTGASTVTITPGQTAAHGFGCSVDDETHSLTLIQTGHSTTTCTLSATSVTANDVLILKSAVGF